MPHDCESCKKLGPKCVKENDSVDKCKAFGYDIKKDACAEKPDCRGHEDRPQFCEDCLRMGKACIKEGGHEKACKFLGFNPKKGCKPTKPNPTKPPKPTKEPKPTKPVCATVVPGSCAECLKISKECLKATGQIKNCIKKFNMNKNGECPEKCPTISKCTDCIGRKKHCIKSTENACKDLGFKKGKCKPPIPNCTMPSNCVDCLKKPASKDKKCQKAFKKKCGKDLKCQTPREGDGFFV